MRPIPDISSPRRMLGRGPMTASRLLCLLRLVVLGFFLSICNAVAAPQVQPLVSQAILPASAQIRYVPHYIMGAGFVTKLSINNLTGATNNVIVNIISQGGVLQSSTNYMLAGHATQ